MWACRLANASGPSSPSELGRTPKTNKPVPESNRIRQTHRPTPSRFDEPTQVIDVRAPQQTYLPKPRTAYGELPHTR